MRTVPMIFWSVVVLAAGGGLTWALIYYKKEAITKTPEVLPPLVRSLVVKAKDLRIDVRTEGTVAPRTEIALTAEVAGKVIEVAKSLEVGGFFAKGDELVKMDDRDYKVAIAQAQARVAQARLVLSREEAEAEVARREWKELGKGQPTPLTLREPQVAEAKASLAAAEASSKKAELDLERTVVRAPFAGRVREKHVDVGQYVGRGTVLSRIYGVDYAEVRLPLHDSELQFLDLPLLYRGEGSSAAPCKVILRTRFAGREERWDATIVRTEGEIDRKSRMVHAIAQVENPYAKGENTARPPLVVGMFVQAEIHGRVFRGVFEVPRDAIRGGNKVLVVDDDSRLRFRTVEVLRSGYEIAILRTGLRDGERICISPLATVVDGMKVRIQEDIGEAVENGR